MKFTLSALGTIGLAATGSFFSVVSAVPEEDRIASLPSFGAPPTAQFSGYLDGTDGCDTSVNGDECRIHVSSFTMWQLWCLWICILWAHWREHKILCSVSCMCRKFSSLTYLSCREFFMSYLYIAVLVRHGRGRCAGIQASGALAERRAGISVHIRLPSGIGSSSP